MTVEWLAYDEVDQDALPAWARGDDPVLDGKPYGVRIGSEGLTLLRGRRASAVRWEQILTPVRLHHPRRLLVSAPRRPPRPPWFELGGLDVDAIEAAVRARLEALDHRGYRKERPSREPMPLGQLLDAVLAREALPGAVEIPAATPGVLRSAAMGGALGGGLLGLCAVVLGPWGPWGAALGALGGAALMSGIELAQRRTAGRVLVLTPDGFVGGLDGRDVRAVAWTEVGRFTSAVDRFGDDALEVIGPQGQLVARVAARFLGAPLEVIVAVAEAYRARATG